MQTEREFSVWVGDLSPDVDDYSLYRVFASKYNSIKTAKGELRTTNINLCSCVWCFCTRRRIVMETFLNFI